MTPRRGTPGGCPGSTSAAGTARRRRSGLRPAAPPRRASRPAAHTPRQPPPPSGPTSARCSCLALVVFSAGRRTALVFLADARGAVLRGVLGQRLRLDPLQVVH